MLLTAIRGHDYQNKWRSPGETYEATEPTAHALVLAGVSKYASLPDIVASPQQEPTLAVDETPRRHYKRRDMVPIK